MNLRPKTTRIALGGGPHHHGRDPGTRYTTGGSLYGDVFDTWVHDPTIDMVEHPDAYQRVATCATAELAQVMCTALNDLARARGQATGDLEEAYAVRADDLRAELRRHQDACTRHTERSLVQHSPPMARLAGDNLGVVIARDVVARAVIARAVTAVLDDPAFVLHPHIGSRDAELITDRARQLAADALSEFGEDDAIDYLITRTASAEPDQVAGQPPAQPVPFPPRLG